MPLSIKNPEADALIRTFAAMTGVSITEAIVVAMKEAIARRQAEESPVETAVRLREKYGLSARPTVRKKLPPRVFNDMWSDGQRLKG